MLFPAHVRIKAMMKRLILAAAIASASPAMSQQFLDTQYGPNGVEVHLLKASVANEVLTVAFMLENTTGSRQSLISLGITEVAYTTADTKFPVLRDVNDQYLASTITYEKNADQFIFAAVADDENTISLDEEERQVGWVKFEAPDASEWPIEVSLPGVSPFTISQPSE